MQELIQILTYVHVIVGSIGLAAAPIAMAVSKGGKLHRLSGKVFFYSICLTCLTAIITGYWHGKYALVLISFFSFHLVASGYRSLFLKKLHKGQKPATLDKALHGGALFVNLGLLIWGLAMTLLKVKGSMSIVYIAFGSIGALFAFTRLRRFYTPGIDQRQWFFDHITGFIAGYIAALSAFSVNVLIKIIPMPAWFAWLWPAMIGAPLIYFWVRSYRKRLRGGEKLRRMVSDIRLGREKA